MSSALEGIKVVDMTRVLAGPWATQMLADFGADVIKIERPDIGDETRHWGPPWYENTDYKQSAYFLCANRNKRSIALDMVKQHERDTLKELIKEADVLVENFKVGGLKKYGLDYESLKELNPRLIYCSITGFGQTGPYAERLGYDFMIQGLGGLMSVTGDRDENGGEPTKIGVALTDVMTGLYVCNAVLAALFAREKSDEGQYIDVSLLDVCVATLANQATNYLVSHNAPQRLGNAHPNIVPYQAFATSDGHVIIAVGNDRQFIQLSKMLDEPSWAEDSRFKTNEQRVMNREIITASIANILKVHPSEFWLNKMAEFDVPGGPINNIEQVFDDAQVKHRQMKLNQHGVPGVANPIRFSKTKIVKSERPPLLDEHHQAILRDWLGQ